MREVFGDLWTLADEMQADAVCITTNGYVTNAGKLVMGRGVAQQARDRFKGLDYSFGIMVKEVGSRVLVVRTPMYAPYVLVSFPVKPALGPSGEPGWKAPADLGIIERSARQLVTAADNSALNWNTVLLPQPGTGNGRLKWEDVKPVIEPILDDRFVVVTYDGK